MKIIWSQRALDELDSITDYLFTHWGEEIASNYMKRIDTLISHILDIPRMYPESRVKKGVRRCVISKHNTLYYMLMSDGVEIITVFDNRQDNAKKNL